MSINSRILLNKYNIVCRSSIYIEEYIEESYARIVFHIVRISAACRVGLRSGMSSGAGEGVGVLCVVLRTLRIAIKLEPNRKGCVDASDAWRWHPSSDKQSQASF